MKLSFLVLLFGLFSTSAFAQEVERITYESGYGRESGSCDSTGGSFCIDRLKRDAEQRGKRDAQTRCEMNRGRPLLHTARCSTYCSPSYIPPRSPRTYVICDANCQIQCEVN